MPLAAFLLRLSGSSARDSRALVLIFLSDSERSLPRAGPRARTARLDLAAADRVEASRSMPDQEPAPALARRDVREPGLLARARRRLRIVARLWRLYSLRAALRLAPRESQRLIVLTALLGAICGLAAVAFHLSIELLERNLIERALDAPRGWVAWTIATPTLGGLVCGILLQYLVPRARGSGIPEVKAVFAQRGRQLRLGDSAG